MAGKKILADWLKIPLAYEAQNHYNKSVTRSAPAFPGGGLRSTENIPLKIILECARKSDILNLHHFMGSGVDPARNQASVPQGKCAGLPGIRGRLNGRHRKPTWRSPGVKMRIRHSGNFCNGGAVQESGADPGRKKRRGMKQRRKNGVVSGK